MKQWSLDARTMGHSTHSPFEFTAIGIERKEAQGSPYPIEIHNSIEWQRPYRISYNFGVAGAVLDAAQKYGVDDHAGFGCLLELELPHITATS